MKKNVVSNRLHSPSRVVIVVVVVVVVSTLHFIIRTQKSTTTKFFFLYSSNKKVCVCRCDEYFLVCLLNTEKKEKDFKKPKKKNVKISLHFCSHNTRAYSHYSFSNDDDDDDSDDDFNNNNTENIDDENESFECSRRRRKRRKRRTKTFCPSSSTEGVRSSSDVLVVHVHFLFLLDLLFVKYDIIQHAERSALLLEQLEEPQRLFHRFR